MSDDANQPNNYTADPQAKTHTLEVATSTWTRLSPTTRNDAMTQGLRAEIHDPLWALGRQWQVGELQGEDAGSPVRVDVWHETDELSRVDLRPEADGDTSFAYDYREDGPLETVVEREPVLTDPDDEPNREAAVEAGRRFLALLREHGYELSDLEDEPPRAPAATDFPESYRLGDADGPVDAAGERFLSVMSDRSLDGRALYDDLSADGAVAATADWQSVDWSGVSTPTPAGGAVTDAYRRAAKAFVDWYAGLYDEPDPGESAWNRDRMEYEFRATTGAGDDETVFAADEYAGGRLDRADFSVVDDEAGSTAADELLGLPTGFDPTDVPVGFDGFPLGGERTDPDLSAIPSPVTFPGMPSPRWWEFEDGGVNLTNVDVGPGEVGKLLLTEHALLYGNDWFSIPLEVDIGTLSRITDVQITDTFGVVEHAEPTVQRANGDDEPGHSDGDESADGPDLGDEAQEGTFGGAFEPNRRWNAFVHTGVAGEPGRSGLLIPPVLGAHHESEPIERVVLMRDEMANMAFGVELATEDAVGDPLQWDEFTPPSVALDGVSFAEDPTGTPDGEYVRLENPGESELDVRGWTVRNDAGDAYEFPDDAVRAVIDAGETVTLHTGGGTDDGSNFHWDAPAPVWGNSDELLVEDAEGRIVTHEFLTEPADPALPDYRLVTDVPEHWFPLKMVPAEDLDDAFEIGDVRFRLSRLLDQDAEIRSPAGKILERGLSLYDEELTRAGLEVTRSYQYARWVDGETHLWAGRRAGVGRGEGASGLLFDIIEAGGLDGGGGE